MPVLQRGPLLEGQQIEQSEPTGHSATISTDTHALQIGHLAPTNNTDRNARNGQSNHQGHPVPETTEDRATNNAPRMQLEWANQSHKRMDGMIHDNLSLLCTDTDGNFYNKTDTKTARKGHIL